MVQVTAAIIQHPDRALANRYLIARKRIGKLAGMWEFPGGKIEPGESPEECLQREIFEEFGIKITIDQYLTTSCYTYPHISIELIGFLATYREGELMLSDHDQIQWVTLSEMDNYSFAPADIPLIVALQKACSQI